MHGQNFGVMALGSQYINYCFHSAEACRDLSQVKNKFDADPGRFHVLMHLDHFYAASMDDTLPPRQRNATAFEIGSGYEVFRGRENLKEWRT